MTQISAMQVNSTDYDGDIVVEVFDGESWSVPAWDEIGWQYVGLCGPFATASGAEAALTECRNFF